MSLARERNMSMRAIDKVALAALAAASFVWTSSANATVMVELPIEDMAVDCDAIVVASVERVGVRLHMRDGLMEPHTLSTLRVLSWIKGPGGDRVTIEEIGGELPGPDGQTFGMRIDGTPEYHTGDQVLVFLRRMPTGTYRTYGMVQGRFDIRRGVGGADDLVHRDTGAVAFARWAGGEMTVEEGGAGPVMRLSDFAEHLRRVLEQAGGRTL